MERLKPHTVYYMSSALLHLSPSEVNELLAKYTLKSQTSISAEVVKLITFIHNSVFGKKKKKKYLYVQRMPLSYKMKWETAEGKQQSFSRWKDSALLRWFCKVNREQVVRRLLQSPWAT